MPSLPQSLMPNSTSLLGPKIVPAASTTTTTEEEEWDNDLAADRADMDAFKECARNALLYTADENKCFEVGRRMEETVAASSGGGVVSHRTTLKVSETTHSRLNASTAYVDGVHYGHVTCEVRASALDVLAFYNEGSNSKYNNKYERGSSTKELKTLEVMNNHRSIVYGR